MIKITMTEGRRKQERDDGKEEKHANLTTEYFILLLLFGVSNFIIVELVATP